MIDLELKYQKNLVEAKIQNIRGHVRTNDLVKIHLVG